MNHPPVDRLYDSSSYQSDLYANALQWQIPNYFIMKRAIVISVKLGVDVNEQTSSLLPQYSINARVIGEDLSDTYPEQNIPNWFLPLISNSIVSIPEIGEQVLVIRETLRNDAKGYWIGRVNDSDRISLKLTNNQLKSGNPLPQQRYGMSFDVGVVNKRSKQPNSFAGRNVFQLPGKLGDLIMQGRSGSFIRHSYNPQSGVSKKPAVLEMGILENKEYNQFPTASVGVTKTKTIHLSDTKASILGPLFIKATPDSDYFYEESFYGSKLVRPNKNIIANLASEIYNISDAPDSEKYAHRQVLGEKLNNFLSEQDAIISSLIVSVTDIVDTIGILFTTFVNHVHTIPEINIDIPDKEISFDDRINLGVKMEPQDPLRVFVASQDVDIPGSGARTVTKTIQTPAGPKTYTEEISGTPGSTVTIPSKFISVPQPDKAINRGYRTQKRTKIIEYEKISIGGAANPRNTTTIETNMMTDRVQNDLNDLKDNFTTIHNSIINLSNDLNGILSKRNFIN